MPRHTESTLAAIKNAVDLVALIGEYLPLQRSGAKYKALCPFHDDHHPSLEVNPDRQSYKCWSCGAGGDVFDFVKEYERVEFPEAVRMLAERAGVALESPDARPASRSGPTKADLLAVNAWAERTFADLLARAPEAEEARAYLAERGIHPESVERFALGYAPPGRDWLAARAKRDGFAAAALEQAGLLVRTAAAPGLVRERFRGRLLFPIHDFRGRTLGFGGRILPSIARRMAEEGRDAAKYLNTPETPLFQKRRLLYASHLARTAAREAGWVAVVEGYTDVIAAHQVGIANVVGTLGTALGDDHLTGLRRLADRVLLVFDGDAAGQAAAERALEIFLGHAVDVRIVTLPAGEDPCDFLLVRGAEAFRERVERATDPLEFLITKVGESFDLDAIEGSRQAADWFVSRMARIPRLNRGVLDVKVAKALDTLAQRLRVPVGELHRRLRELRQPSRTAARPRPGAGSGARAAAEGEADAGPRATVPIRLAELDAIDRELVELALNAPQAVDRLIRQVPVKAVRDPALRAILQVCYDLHDEGEPSTFDRVALRLDDPALRALAAGLLLPIDPTPLPDGVRPAPWDVRLAGVLAQCAERDRQDRVRSLKAALDAVDRGREPERHQALLTEYRRLLNQRPDTKSATAS